MKTLKHITLGLILVSTTYSHAQNGRLKYANKMFENKAYYTASEAYEDVLERKIDSSLVAQNITICYDKMGDYQKATKWYRYLARNGELSKEQHLRFAMLEKQQANHNDADILLASYQDKYGSSDIPITLLESDIKVEDLKVNKGQFEVFHESINTDNSEMGVSYVGKDKILFASSTRRAKSPMRVHSWANDYFYNLYLAPINTNGDIGKVAVLKAESNTKYHDGPASYNEKSGYVYFTRSNIIAGKKIVDKENTVLLKIMKGKLVDNRIENIEVLSINSDNYITAHPSLSKDGKRLYFSSDRPGGLGGMDIYYVELDEKGNPKGDVINMGSKVNTTQNEVFPYYHTDENLLFFSSNGHLGLGGLDVYAASLNKAFEAVKVENLGAPVNSKNDDFSFVNNDEQTAGYFASNRSGGSGKDDIYSLKQAFPLKNIYNLDYYISGLIRDQESLQPIETVTVTLSDENQDSEENIFTTNEEGRFLTEEIPYSYDDLLNYKVTLEKEGYITRVIDFSETLAENDTIDITEYLKGMVKIEIDKTDLNDIVDIAPINFDLNSSYLRSDAFPELDKVVKIMKENPTLKIDLRAHTDSRGEQNYNQWLSERRALRSAEYIISQGIEESRLTHQGFGQSKLIYSDEEISRQGSEAEKEALHEKNRRTEFIVVE